MYTFLIHRANISAIFVVFSMQLVTNLHYTICSFLWNISHLSYSNIFFRLILNAADYFD